MKSEKSLRLWRKFRSYRNFRLPKQDDFPRDDYTRLLEEKYCRRNHEANLQAHKEYIEEQTYIAQLFELDDYDL